MPPLNAPCPRFLEQLGWVGALSLAALCIAVPAHAQLIVTDAQSVTNGGFETADFTGWSLSGEALDPSVNNTFVFGDPHSGDYSAWLGPAGSDGYLSQSITTIPGDPYTVSYWLAVDSADSATGLATPNDFSTSFGGVSLFSQADLAATDSHASPADDYTQYTFTTVAASASSLLQFGFRDDPSEFRLDDVSVTGPAAVPEASTTVSLGLLLALGGLSAIVRRKHSAKS